MRRALLAAGGLVAVSAAAAAFAQTPLDARTAALEPPADAATFDAAPADRHRAAHAFDATTISPQLLRSLAKGTLWRAELGADSSLSLRWRRGQIALVLAIRLDGGH